jgi:hypothetical protein
MLPSSASTPWDSCGVRWAMRSAAWQAASGLQRPATIPPPFPVRPARAGAPPQDRPPPRANRCPRFSATGGGVQCRYPPVAGPHIEPRRFSGQHFMLGSDKQCAHLTFKTLDWALHLTGVPSTQCQRPGDRVASIWAREPKGGVLATWDC